MYIREIRPGKNQKVTVLLEEGLSFPLYRGEADRYGLQEGKELTGEMWETICTELLEKRARKRALFLLQKMDRTEAQMRDRLRESGYPDEIVESAVDYVKSYHYIDDLRYAASYIRYHQEEKSRMQLVAALRKRGIGREVIEQALEQEYTQEEDLLIKKLLDKRHYDALRADEKEKRRVYAFLVRRGFSHRAVKRCMDLRECGQEDIEGCGLDITGKKV